MWLRMASAPRDGTEIFILTAEGAYAMKFIEGEWNQNYYDGDWKDSDTWCALGVTGGDLIPENLIIESETYNHEDGTTYEDNEALAWMPMPINTEEMRNAK